jgi:acyl carrier protein
MKEKIRQHLSQQLPEHKITDDFKLFTSGVLDSFGVLEIIAFLEDTFGVVIDTSRHELIQFDTINDMEKLVLSLREGSAAHVSV